MAISKIEVHLSGSSAEEPLNDLKILLWSLGFETEEVDGKVVVSAHDLSKLQTNTVVVHFE